MNPEFVDYIGYAASAFVVISFILKDLKKIRLTNLIGCILFVIYGVNSGDKIMWPIVIPNAILCFVQVYNLLKNDKKEKTV